MLTTVGILVRPWNVPEFVWALIGAAVLVALKVLSWSDALGAAAKGTDVYLFLIGMMLLSEVARAEGLFDWLAVKAVQPAKGSATRFFLIVYFVGIWVTVFLSNDATAVVLTPAVYAAARAAKVEPLPYLFVCAFIANAASFVLPISNPANLVVMGAQMPPLKDWLELFAIPSLVSIVVTYLMLHLVQRRHLSGRVAQAEDLRALSPGARIAAVGIVITAIVLMTASALGRDLGLPTFIAGSAVTLLVTALGRTSLGPILRHVSWSVLPLVAGLFILVEALSHAGMLAALTATLKEAAASSPRVASLSAGLGVGVFSNLINNLPMGLIAANLTQGGHLPIRLVSAMLIGVDLGPNLSVTGSLATLLWLIALRREGENVAALQFLRVGLVVMPPTLLLALLVS